MKQIKIIAIVLLAVLLLPIIAACNPIVPTPEPSKHECEHVCPTCGKCTDQTCTDSACADKCGGHAEPASEQGWYTLKLKTISGINVTDTFLTNAIHLYEGKADWYQITLSGTELSQGTYTAENGTVTVKIGLKTYAFTTDGNYSYLTYQGKINRKSVVMNYDKNSLFAFSQDKGQVNFSDELFGDDIEKNFYNYCPTAIIEDRTMHVWYCSNKDDGNVTDHVAYRKGTLHDDGRWTFGDKQLVLEHGTSGQWDSRHVCDPTVVKGVFKNGTETYNYMMAFLGCLTSNNTKNEVGVAFAKSPEGPWVKYGDNPIADFYADYSLSRTDSSANSEIAANSSWGYGQPSLISADKNGKVILFYSAGVPTGTFTVAELWDFGNIQTPVRLNKLMVSNKGITNASGGQDVINNADFAYDAQRNRLYCIKEDFPYPTGNGINWIAGTNSVFYVDLGEGKGVADRIFEDYNYTWTMAGTLNEAMTGFKRNHNAGLLTDAYGQLTDSTRLAVLYTMSKTPEDFPDWSHGGQWPALHTYRIHGITIEL